MGVADLPVIRTLLLLVALFSGGASASPVTALVVGDSLSAAYGMDRNAGWVSLLRERLAERDGEARVVNASTSGDTTRTGLSRLPRALEEHRPDLVIIELGGNDGLRGVDLAETRRNLARMVEMAQANGARVLLVGVRLPTNYGSAFIERFQAVFRDVADEYGVPLVPRFLEGVAERPELMQNDGIHPSAEAQPYLLDNLWPAIEAMLEDAA